MALSARPVGVPSGPNISSAHMPAGGRNVATTAFNPVEEIAAKAEVFADPNFSFQGFAQWMRDQDQDHQPPRNPTGGFETNTTTFVHLLSQQQRDSDPAQPGNATSAKNFQMIVKKAVHAYETTAEVISGAPRSLGASVSYSL